MLNLKLQWRQFVKEKQFSLLNLLGLSTGLACAMFILLWVNDERSIDTFHHNDQTLYQVIKTGYGSDGSISTFETTPAIMAKAMADELPEVEYAVPVQYRDKGIVLANNKAMKALPHYAGKDFFKVFSYELMEGNRGTLLSDPKGIILSDKLALKLFNTTKGLIGKTVEWENMTEINGSYTITGIFKMPPSNATDQFDVILSFDHYYSTYQKRFGLDLWYSNSVFTFLRLRDGTNVTAFNEKIKEYSRKKMLIAHGPEGLKYEGPMFVQRYSEKYLYNRYENGKITGGRIEYVRLFSIIAAFIVFLACINFMNLATAKATTRLKEVGIRKVVGAGRGSLILQYLGESTFMAFLSLVIAVLIVIALLPQFEKITQKNLQFTFNTVTVTGILVLTFVTGLLSGIYPAIYLSSFRPISVLKGSITFSGNRNLMRKGLVIFQFSLSVIFIIAFMVVNRQMKLIRHKNLGFNKDNIIYFSTEGEMQKQFQPMLTQLKKIPGVVNVAAMDGDLTGMHGGGGGISWPGQTSGQAIEFAGLNVIHGWTEMLGVGLVEGRPFAHDGRDSAGVLFNEAAIRAMRLKDPVGKKVMMWGKESVIVGVVKNFHYESLYKRPGPLFLRYIQLNKMVSRSVLVKIQAGSEKKTLAAVKTLYERFNKGLEFEYAFMDEDFQKLYASENRVAVLSVWFTGLAILISCLGLFGLAAFTAQKRQKEIGIRKVVGAAVHQIAFMLTREFVKLVVIALLIAFPAAWWVMNDWLMDFEYRVILGWDVFVIAAVGILSITLVTVSFQAVKAAVANPVKSLRTE